MFEYFKLSGLISLRKSLRMIAFVRIPSSNIIVLTTANEYYSNEARYDRQTNFVATVTSDTKS